jgi:MFS family permease
MRAREYLGPLRNRPFRLLWLGQTGSSAGDALIQVALAFAVLDVSGAGGLGLVFAAFIGSRVLFILGGGVWADRVPRRLVMLVADAVRAAVQLVLGLQLITGNAELWHFVVGSFLTGAASAFFGPASTGLIPETVSTEELQQANALMSLSRSAIGVLGPAVGGFLVAAFGPGWVFTIDSASYVFSAAFLAVLRVPPMPERVRQNFLSELHEGWREVRSRTWLSAGLVAASFANISIATYFVLGPLVAEDELGGAEAWGIALAGGPIGAVIGSMLALRLRPRRPLFVAFLIWTVPSLQLLALVPPLPALALACAAAASVLAVELGNVFWNTVVQRDVPEHALSRVNSYDWMVSLLFMPLGYTIAPVLAEQIGRDRTLVLAAAIAAIGNLAALTVPSVRAYRAMPAPAPASSPEYESAAPAPRAQLP